MHRKAESLPICSQSYRHFDETDPSLPPRTRPRSQSGVDRTTDEDLTLGSLALEQSAPALASLPVHSYSASGHLRVPSTSSDTLPNLRTSTAISSQRTANEFPQEAQFQCNECGRRFSLLCRLRSHYLESHVQLKPFRCTTPGCSATFANASRLKRHTASHTASRNFICDGIALLTPTLSIQMLYLNCILVFLSSKTRGFIVFSCLPFYLFSLSTCPIILYYIYASRPVN